MGKKIEDWLDSLHILVLGLIVLIVIGSISLPLTWLFMSLMPSSEERRIDLSAQCTETLSSFEGQVEGIYHYGNLLCFAFQEDGTIKGRILEDR